MTQDDLDRRMMEDLATLPEATRRTVEALIASQKEPEVVWEKRRFRLQAIAQTLRYHSDVVFDEVMRQHHEGAKTEADFINGQLFYNVWCMRDELLIWAEDELKKISSYEAA
jgi:hypothetical protein